MTRTERSVIALVTALYVLAWLATVGASAEVEHVDGDDDFGARWREVGSA